MADGGGEAREASPHLPISEDAAVEARKDGLQDGRADRGKDVLLCAAWRKDAVEGEVLGLRCGARFCCGQRGDCEVCAVRPDVRASLEFLAILETNSESQWSLERAHAAHDHHGVEARLD